MESSRVLLLNASYEPIRVISWRRAVVLVVQEKAEVILDTDRFIHSEKGAMNLPSVIRLKYFVKIPYRARIPLNRRTVLIRDNHECQFTHCTRKGTTIDHVMPKSKGGKNVWENVVAACQKCNAEKSDKILGKGHPDTHIDWELRKVPVQPNWNLWLVAGLRERPEWTPYLEQFDLA